MKAACTLFPFTIGTPAKPFCKFALLMFIPGMFFVSQHTETLQKHYRKYAKILARSQRFPLSIPGLTDSDPHVQHFILRSIKKYSGNLKTSCKDWKFG